jgi:oligopeptidase B
MTSPMTSRLLDETARETAAGGASVPAPPVADRRPAASTWHGVTRVDDYAWLRDGNWQQVMHEPGVLAPDIRAYLDAENAYAEAAMADVGELRKALFKEMRGRIKEDDSSVPSPDGPYAYAVRYREGGEHPLLVRTPRDGGPETVLLDADAMARGKAYFRLGGSAHSPDHKLLAYAVDERGSEYFEIRVRDLATGADLADVIPATAGAVAWAADGRTFFYVHMDENHRPSSVHRHVVGSDPAGDALVYAEADPGFFVGVGTTQSEAFIVIDTHDHETSEVRLIDARDPAAEPRLVAGRKTGEEYHLDHGDDRFFILTNAGGAEDFKIVTAPVAAPGRENWQDLVPHVEGRLILHATSYKDFLVRLERENSLARIVIRHLASGEEHAIAFAEEAYSLGMIDGYEFDTTSLRFTYSSMTTPTRVFDYDMATRARVLRKEDEIPSGHDPSHYVTRRVFAPAPDGELVPVSLLWHRDTRLDGSAPLLLYGYGAYGIAIPASFSISRLSLVDRGFVYAIAHIRGGKDKGFAWYEDGKMEKKTNTFKDFIAAADYLNQEKFTSYANIIAEGGSAGGMLMGAVANMAPEKFAGLIAAVPFVDVLNTMLDDTLPLTPPEWPEWGNPIESKEDYEQIAAYSPYDNVGAKAYPPILALGGLTDPRVTYWEPAKWAARLREKTTGSAPILLKTNMDAGHGGASGRFQRLEEIAFEYAFAIKVAGKI